MSQLMSHKRILAHVFTPSWITFWLPLHLGYHLSCCPVTADRRELAAWCYCYVYKSVFVQSLIILQQQLMLVLVMFMHTKTLTWTYTHVLMESNNSLTVVQYKVSANPQAVAEASVFSWTSWMLAMSHSQGHRLFFCVCLYNCYPTWKSICFCFF